LAERGGQAGQRGDPDGRRGAGVVGGLDERGDGGLLRLAAQAVRDRSRRRDRPGEE
jgi:hypothetical protein